jgi:multidrug efflux system membrane fusion protein
LLAGLGYFWLSSAGLRTDRPPQEQANRRGAPNIPVNTAAADRGDIPVYLDGLGTITPLNIVTVRSRVDGELLRVAFTEGQTVRKGDLLAEIDPRPFEAQLGQAEGQLARDEALLENARVDLQRYQTLLSQDSIAPQQVSGQSALVRQHRASVAVDKAQIAAIKLQLTYCRITAPVSGRAGLRLIDPGNVVHANDQNGLVVITQTQPISAVFTLPEDKLPAIMEQVRSSRPVTTEAFDRAGTTRLARGRLLAVDNQIDPTTGTVKLKALFENADGSLFANQFVNVRLNLEPLRDATIIPSAAVQHGSTGDFAYLVGADGKVRMQTVKLGPKDGERVAIIDGLAQGAEVVIEGTDRLRDGSVVQVIKGPSSANAAVLPAEDKAADQRPAHERRQRRTQ